MSPPSANRHHFFGEETRPETGVRGLDHGFKQLVALKRPAVGHLLAAGDTGLTYPGEHEALEEAALWHARHAPCPE